MPLRLPYLIFTMKKTVETAVTSAKTDAEKKVFHTLVTISLGLVRVEPGHVPFTSPASPPRLPRQRQQAKKIPGNSLFIDRRLGPYASAERDDGAARPSANAD
jgi:hypothetical protein